MYTLNQNIVFCFLIDIRTNITLREFFYPTRKVVRFYLFSDLIIFTKQGIFYFSLLKLIIFACYSKI